MGDEAVQFTASAARRIARAVRRVEGMAADLTPRHATAGPRAMARPLGIVISSEPIETADPVVHWKYSCSFVRKVKPGYGDDVWEADSETPLEGVLNLAEHANPESGLNFGGVATDHMDPDGDDSYPWKGKPIPNGAIVELMLIPVEGAEPEWHVVGGGWNNSIDGTCP